MEHVPFYIDLTFYLTALAGVLLAWKAARYAKPFTGIVAAWMLLQFVVARTGFYTVTNMMPPRLGLLLFPPLVVIAILSALFPLQQFGFEQPNIAILYAPYVWLPGVLVPLVIFSHLVAIRRFLRRS